MSTRRGLGYRVSRVAYRQQRGFALLLTLIVVGVIGAVAFGVGYLTLHSYSATVRFQDSQSALQAAEAGIEDGLLRFRFDRNAEVPYKIAGAPCPDPTIEPTQTSSYVLRVNLTTTDETKRLQCLDPTTAPTPNPSDIVYDLKVYYKGSQLGAFGSPNLTNSTDSPKILKDGVLEISGIDPADRSSMRLRYAIVSPTTTISSIADQRGQIQYFNNAGAILGTRIIHLADEQEAVSSQLGFSFVPLIGTTSLAFKPYAGDEKVALKYSSNKPVDFGFTHVESSGYANGVKRKLFSRLDRTSGSTQGIYNFVLYGGSDSALGL